MRNMWHPDYVYRPWPEARRKAASVRMKRLIAMKKKAYKDGWRDGQKALAEAANKK